MAYPLAEAELADKEQGTGWVRCDDVGSQAWFADCQHPKMQIMNLLHSFDPEELSFKLFEIDVRWHCLHQHEVAGFQDRYGEGEGDDREDESHYRVNN